MQVIASVLLVFAGTEVLVLAPYIFEIAAMIDIFGMAMIVAAIRSSFSVSMAQVRDLLAAATKPLVATFRAADALADFGLVLLPRWDRQYLIIDAFSTRAALTLILLAMGMVVTRGIAPCA